MPAAATGSRTMFNVSAILNHFNELSLPCLTDVMSHMKPTTCPTDLISSRLLKEGFHVVGSSVLYIINK